MNEYQWYPGHMTKAMRMMRASIAPVDLVIELADARIPYASRNPDIDELSAGKARLLILNKSDLADEAENRLWEKRFRDAGLTTVLFNAKKKGEAQKALSALKRLMSEKTAKDAARGMAPQIKAMVAGVPNVGKSTLINCLAGRALTKTANKPGVTRGKQWIALADNIRLLDTPGVLWPKFEDETVGEHLALIGSMNDVNLDMETMAVSLIRFLEVRYPDALPAAYDFAGEDVDALCETQTNGIREAAVLYCIAKRRGALMRGSRPDYEKASSILMNEFRAGKLGRITLEPAETAGG